MAISTKNHKIYSIYMLTNTVNSKIYIGFTSRNPQKRLTQHIWDAYFRLDGILQRAIRKYGIASFELTVLYESDDEQYCLNVMEPFFIGKYKSLYPKGYNMTNGGEGSVGRTCNESTKHKISRANSGKIRTDELKLKLSQIRTGTQNGFFGKHHSDETRKKISEANRNPSDETRKKISSVAKNRPVISDETREKISKAHKGRIFSKEHRKKLSEAAKRRYSGNKYVA